MKIAPLEPNMSTKSKPQPGKPAAKPRKYFSLDEANRALPYVARIVDDIRAAYHGAVQLQHQAEQAGENKAAEALRRDYDTAVQRLRQYVEELTEVGVDLKDYEQGLIDFPALHEGREICLCWKCGEEKIVAWHEVHAGFAGRKDTALLS